MKSTCCKSTVHIADFAMKRWYQCDACGHPCDVMDEAPALDQLREYLRENSMVAIPDGKTEPVCKTCNGLRLVRVKIMDAEADFECPNCSQEQMRNHHGEKLMQVLVVGKQKHD